MMAAPVIASASQRVPGCFFWSPKSKKRARKGKIPSGASVFLHPGEHGMAAGHNASSRLWLLEPVISLQS